MRHKKELNHSKNTGGKKEQRPARVTATFTGQVEAMSQQTLLRKNGKGGRINIRTLQPKGEHVSRWWNPSPGSNAAEKWENLMPEKFLLDLVACKS